MIIDAKDLILGRLSAFAAKKALQGEKIDIVNCEKAIVTGNRKVVFAAYFRKIKLGAPLFGPYYPRTPDRLVRRTIRGMLPYRKERGKNAFKNIMCYIGVPAEFKDKKLETMPGISKDKLSNIKYVTVAEISKSIGSKV